MKTLKDDLVRLLLISFGVFLFILFFQPFPLEMPDFNKNLLFVTGFAGITFLSGVIFYILFPMAMPGTLKQGSWDFGPPSALSFFFLAITTTAFAFYVRFVGKVPVSFFTVFNMGVICLFAVITIIVLYRFKSLSNSIDSLEENNSYYRSRLEELEQTRDNEEIEFISASKAPNLVLQPSQVVLIKSADNYIEINYLEEDILKKQLIRGTLKSIELQLSKRKRFIRCHRTCMVNSDHIEKLQRSYSGYSLKMKDFDESIPVSRQYLIQVNEAARRVQTILHKQRQAGQTGFT